MYSTRGGCDRCLHPRRARAAALGCSTPLASAREAAAFAAQPRASLRPAGAHAMANDDLIKDVFGGSDSDTDDDAPAPAARGGDSGDEEAPRGGAPGGLGRGGGAQVPELAGGARGRRGRRGRRGSTRAGHGCVSLARSRRDPLPRPRAFLPRPPGLPPRDFRPRAPDPRDDRRADR